MPLSTIGPAARLPPPVLVQAEELGPRLQLGEGAGEVHVAEDLVGLDRLVAAADEDGVSALPDQLDALEIRDDGRHHERQHPLSLQLARGGPRGRLELLLVELEAELAGAPARAICPRPGRVVRDEAQAVALGAQRRRPPPRRRGSARRRRAAHRRRRAEWTPWSGSLFGSLARSPSRWPRSSSASPARAGRAASTPTRPTRVSRRSSTSQPRRH